MTVLEPTVLEELLPVVRGEQHQRVGEQALIELAQQPLEGAVHAQQLFVVGGGQEADVGRTRGLGQLANRRRGSHRQCVATREIRREASAHCRRRVVRDVGIHQVNKQEAFTESLFLLLAVSTFVATESRQWLRAGVFIGLAAITRPNGAVTAACRWCSSYAKRHI